ncbi:MAG: hypothetical protein HN576_17550 [Bacteriovoracaceae bacterium]|nr:hypothetical protein [Bacteriovoracaceae bacterium]
MKILIGALILIFGVVLNSAFATEVSPERWEECCVPKDNQVLGCGMAVWDSQPTEAEAALSCADKTAFDNVTRCEWICPPVTATGAVTGSGGLGGDDISPGVVGPSPGPKPVKLKRR